MFQDFRASTRPQDGPPRLAALREAMGSIGLDGFLVPRADAWQGEYVAERDARLAWLTGFTGSAGFAAILPDIAGVFVDGRYRVAVRTQTDTAHFTPLDWPEVQLDDWLKTNCRDGARIGFDPWLHTVDAMRKLRRALSRASVTLIETGNLVDRIRQDRPDAPSGAVTAYPEALAGRSAAQKRADAAGTLRDTGESAAVLTQPDSIAWLLNIRGSDIARIPILQAFAVLHDDGRVTLFADSGKLAGLEDHLGPEVRILSPAEFVSYLGTLNGPVRLDEGSAPVAVAAALGEGTWQAGRDPCLLAKACKSEAEIAGSEAAHLRDGAAVAEFLCWLDQQAERLIDDPEHHVSEIDVVRALEGFRRGTGALLDISFDTIAGSGPNGAIVHYRVDETTDRALRRGDLLLVDSGGQYLDGTTDITRTIPIGEVGETERAAFTRVLKGMIAISRVRFPEGIAGRDLDALARLPLWQAGMDYGHGTGHGVGAYLSVHEGPQRISRTGDEPLKPGMILSNEPGYYREGAFGIRIENLITVEAAPPITGGDDRKMLSFRTLTHVPIDRRLIDAALLSPEEIAWLDAYHRETRARLSDLVGEPARVWLNMATRPI